MADDLAKQLRDIAANGDSLFSRRYIKTLERAAARLDVLEARVAAHAGAAQEMRDLEKIRGRLTILKTACDRLSRDISDIDGNSASAASPDVLDSWVRFIEEQCVCTGRAEDRIRSRDLVASFRGWLIGHGLPDIGAVTAGKALSALALSWQSEVTGFGLTRHKASIAYYRGVAFKTRPAIIGQSPRTPPSVRCEGVEGAATCLPGRLV